MNKNNNSIQGQIKNPDSCQDSLRYHLIEDDGRYKFESVRIEAPNDCRSSSLSSLINYLEGRFLDEVDLSVVNNSSCARNSGCPAEFTKVIKDLRLILLD